MRRYDWLEIIGDCLLVAFGIIMIYIFGAIELFGKYGQEANFYIRWGELIMGVPIIIIGINRLIKDMRE